MRYRLWSEDLIIYPTRKLAERGNIMSTRLWSTDLFLEGLDKDGMFENSSNDSFGITRNLQSTRFIWVCLNSFGGLTGFWRDFFWDYQEFIYCLFTFVFSTWDLSCCISGKISFDIASIFFVTFTRFKCISMRLAYRICLAKCSLNSIGDLVSFVTFLVVQYKYICWVYLSIPFARTNLGYLQATSKSKMEWRWAFCSGC